MSKTQAPDPAPKLKFIDNGDGSITVDRNGSYTCALFKQGGGGIETLAYEMASLLAAAPAAPAPQAAPPDSEAITFSNPSYPAWFAARREAPAAQWQSIETAPKNGLCVLAWRSDLSIPVIAYWAYGKWGGASGYVFHDQPTHWMPLPAAPQTKEQP